MSHKKLVVNVAVVVVCAVIALSIPIIANQLQKPANATNNLQLVCIKTENNLIDARAIWQLELRSGNKVIKTWDKIYQDNANLTYDKQNLQLTSYGLVLPIKQTTEGGYHSVVVYQDYRCVLKLN